MRSVKIKSKKNKIEIEFKSQSFLQQQVRSMVGCLKYVGEKKWSLKKFMTIVMNKRKRILCAPPAPPRGIILSQSYLLIFFYYSWQIFYLFAI